MNMISTGAFQTEMDASDRQSTMAEKFAAVWEKKNAKAARAGGVSLMALSLAACGSDDDTTTTAAVTTTTDTTTTTTPVVPVVVAGNTFDMTPLTDVASSTTAVNGSISSTFRFTTSDDTINAISASIAVADTLLDSSTTDSDTINITATAAMNAMTAVNIENAVVNFASGAAASAVFTNFTGLTSVTVNGTVAGTLSDSAYATTDNYTRILTWNDTTGLGGTAAAGTAESWDLTVQGASYGSTAATRSGVTLTAVTTSANETLETLNITSSGGTENVFALDASDVDVVLGTVNILGDTDMTMRVSHNDINGVTLAAGSNTGDTTLRIDRQADGTTATNLANITGVDKIMVADDAATPAAALVLASAAAGQAFEVVDDMATGGSITVQGAARTAQAASLSITLDNATANTDTDIGGTLDIQNVTALTLTSNGYATSATDGTTENALTLGGDFTSVTVLGDTSLDMTASIDGAGAAGTTARTVIVDASGMTGTARAEIDTAASTVVSYNITGTANNDTLALNAAGGTMTGGAGNDTLTGAAGGDTISGGAGNDTIVVSAGADTITTGAGVDTIDLNANDTAGVAQTSLIGNTVTMAASDVLTVTINGTHSYSTTFGTGHDTTIAAFVTAHAANILKNNGVTATADATDASDLMLTGAAAGTAFTVVNEHNDAGTVKVQATTTTAGTVAIDYNGTVTDFSTSDIINSEGIGALGTGGYFEGASTGMTAGTAYGVVVLTNTSYASSTAAATAVNTTSTSATDAIVIYLDSTTGYAEAYFDDNIGGNNVALGDLFAFTSITTLDLLDDLSTSNFVI
jgi:hypothetical protein